MFGLLGNGVGVIVDDCLGNTDCLLGVLSVLNLGWTKVEQEYRKMIKKQESNNRIFTKDDLPIIYFYLC